MTSFTETPSYEEPIRDSDRLFFLMKLLMDSGGWGREEILKVVSQTLVENNSFRWKVKVNTHQLSESVQGNTEVYSPEEDIKYWIILITYTERCWNLLWKETMAWLEVCYTLWRATWLQLGAAVTPSWSLTAAVALDKRLSDVTASGAPNASWNQAPPIITLKTGMRRITQPIQSL